jgi:hypothetical protein
MGFDQDRSARRLRFPLMLDVFLSEPCPVPSDLDQGGPQECVTFTGPDEILSPARVAAKQAAQSADKAEVEKEADLATIHLDSSKSTYASW